MKKVVVKGGKIKEQKLSEIEEILMQMETKFDTKTYIIFDNGSAFIKAGYSGQDHHRVKFTRL